MTLTLDQLEVEAAKLNATERAALLDRLHSLEEFSNPETSGAWDVELLRRIHQVDTNQVQLLAGPTAMAELRSRHGI